jgi:hypothetical protein
MTYPPLTRYRVVLELDIATGQENEAGTRLGPESWNWWMKMQLDLDQGESLVDLEVYRQQPIEWEQLK